jgi:hypothetical protein
VLDLTPSMAWRASIVSGRVENDHGPVLLPVEYRVSPKNPAASLTAVEKLSHERRRDGA